jgi:hypothetical protein
LKSTSRLAGGGNFSRCSGVSLPHANPVEQKSRTKMRWIIVKTGQQNILPVETKDAKRRFTNKPKAATRQTKTKFGILNWFSGPGICQ